MFKDYYTTAMSSEGKMLEKRFSNITASKKTGRLKSAAASVLTVVIAATTLFMSGVLADTVGSYGAGDIAVLVNGRDVSLTNKPFTDNSEVYVPLRETLNACGVADSNITYYNGQINMTLHSDVTDSDYTAHINIGAQNIKFDGDTAGEWKLQNGARTTTHPAVLKDGVTYIPSGMLIRIKQYDVEIKDKAEHVKDFRYNRALPVKLLKGLKVRLYSEDGGFDNIIDDWTTAESENPEDYYESGERVIIGNAAKQHEQGYHYRTVNYYYFPTNPVKRILTDDDGKVIAVAMVENQKHEAINGSGISSMAASYGERGWAHVGVASMGNPKEGAERGDLDNMDWLTDNAMVCDPETETLGTTTAQCFYIPVELITHRIEFDYTKSE